MADQTIAATEEMVGSGHATKSDTLNRLALISLNIDGTLKIGLTAAAVINDHQLVRGDGGARGVQDSTIIVSDDGEMTNPSQPCFLVKPTSDQENIAVESEVTIIFGTEIFDIGNNFAANIFTAPITGKYLFAFGLRIQNVDTEGGNYWVYIKTSNNIIRPFIISPNVFIADPGFYWMSGSAIVNMDLNDTAYITISQDAGTVQTDIDTDSCFSGALIC